MLCRSLNNLVVYLLVFLAIAGCSSRITHIEPYSALPGEIVTIHGRCLASNATIPTSVQFNGTASVAFRPVNASVEAVVPQGATTGPVAVSTDYAHQDAIIHFCVRGTVESPLDFEVLANGFTEIEPNDVIESANRVDRNHIAGALSNPSDVDWYVISSGPAGPYGYTLEFYASAELPDGYDLRIYFKDESGAVPAQYFYVEKSSADATHNGWTVQAPSQDVHLSVDLVGSSSDDIEPTPYQLSIARLPIQDSQETADNRLNGAIPIEPGVAHVGAYLCSVATSETETDVPDYYSFELTRPQVVKVYVFDAGLPDTHDVEISLWNPYGDHSSSSVDGESFGAYLEVDLPTIWPRPLEHPIFPVGTWYVSVQTHSGTFPNSDSGYAPVGCKFPYAISVVLE